MPIQDLSGGASNYLRAKNFNSAQRAENDRQNMGLTIGGIDRGAQNTVDLQQRQKVQKAEDDAKAAVHAHAKSLGLDPSDPALNDPKTAAIVIAKRQAELDQQKGAQGAANLFGLNTPAVPATPAASYDVEGMPTSPGDGPTLDVAATPGTPAKTFDTTGMSADMIGDYAKMRDAQKQRSSQEAWTRGPFASDYDKQAALDKAREDAKPAPVRNIDPNSPEGIAAAKAKKAAELEAEKAAGAGDFKPAEPKPWKPMTREEQLAFDKERSQVSAEGQNAGGGSEIGNKLKAIQLAIEQTKLGEHETPEQRDAKKIVEDLTAISRDVKRTAMYPGGAAALSTALAAAQAALGTAKSAPKPYAPAATESPAGQPKQSVNDVGASPDEMSKISGNPRLMDAWNAGDAEYRKKALDAMRRGAKK